MFNGRIFVCGDIHGDANVVTSIVNSIENPQADDIIIIAGDAGFEYGNYIMGRAKRAAKKFPGRWIVMRGNHDNCYWKDHIFVENDSFKVENGWNIIGGEDQFIYQNKYPNIWYVHDNGGIYTIGDWNFLFLPGAYSIDKDYRLRMGYPYNPKEQLDTFTMNECYDMVLNWNKMGFPIDYVIGHTFPLKLEYTYRDRFISFIDQSTVDKRTEQWLDNMSNLFEKNPDFKMYYGGHFHYEKKLTDKYTMVYQSPLEIGEN